MNEINISRCTQVKCCLFNTSSNPDRKINVTTHLFIVLVVTSIIVVAVRSVLFYWLCVENAKILYEKMFTSVKDTSIRFFDLNPLGYLNFSFFFN